MRTRPGPTDRKLASTPSLPTTGPARSETNLSCETSSQPSSSEEVLTQSSPAQAWSRNRCQSCWRTRPGPTSSRPATTPLLPSTGQARSETNWLSCSQPAGRRTWSSRGGTEKGATSSSSSGSRGAWRLGGVHQEPRGSILVRQEDIVTSQKVSTIVNQMEATNLSAQRQINITVPEEVQQQGLDVLI